MIQTTKHTLLWLAAGLLLSLAVLLVVWGGLSGKVLVTDPEGIPEAADTVMDSIRRSDWKVLEERVSGNPKLALEIAEEDSAEKLIWEAYLESLQWICYEDFTLSGPYVEQSVSVTCLDIPGVTKAIAEILSETAATADPQVQAQLLHAAARQVLESDPPVRECEVTLTFRREKGQWMLIPTKALQALLSGFTAR